MNDTYTTSSKADRRSGRAHNDTGRAGRAGGRAGFSLMETLIILGVITFIEGATIIIADPWNQFQETRNVQRISNINLITNAVFMNIIDHDGTFVCAAGDIPTDPTFMKSAGGYNIAPCLVPKYVLNFPYDPSADMSYYNSKNDYDTGYQILRNRATGRIIVRAPSAELGQEIKVER